MIEIIIPALNEEESLPKLIQYLKKHGSDKVVVTIVDGGSSDDTIRLAKEAGASVLNAPQKGRSKQMNFGANKSKAEVFYFLHADTFPPESYETDVLESLGKGYSAGCYRLSFDYDHPALKFYCWFTRFDIDFFRFGDQSLFIKREIFKKIGGFDEHLIVMEDQEIVRSLKKITSFNIHKKGVITSARKYRDIGIYKLQLIFTCVLLMYYLGVDHQKIVDFYNSKIT